MREEDKTIVTVKYRQSVVDEALTRAGIIPLGHIRVAVVDTMREDAWPVLVNVVLKIKRKLEERQ
jgi:hypothetical protein